MPPPLPPLPPPPMDIMINSTSAAHASPAESTLTGNPPAAPKNYPPYMVLGSAESNDENVDDNDDDEDGDSYYDGDELKVHLLAVARRYADDEAGDKINSVADAERVVNSLTHHDEEIDDIDDDIGEPPLDEMEHGIAPARQLIGAPDGWNPPCPPPSFNGYQQKHDAPAEKDIDNPAGWSMFTFTANFDSKNKYTFHSTPSGARVVRMNSNGKRQAAGWEFFYRDWVGDDFARKTYARTGAAFGNLKPESRRGSLDVDTLKKHGLTAHRVSNDPMFFYQMLFPLCDPLESGVRDDHRMPYFSNVTCCTNMYAYWKGAGSGYGHDFSPVSIPEIIKWTGVPIRNGALDGRPSTLFHRWQQGDARHDAVISDNMTRQRFLQIKRYFKLNQGFEEKKPGTAGYDPCAKYDYIYRCIIHNMAYVTGRADLDCTIDETTWGHSQ